MLNRETKRIKTPPFSFCSNPDIAIHVPDLASAEAFYGNVLGFRLVTKSDEQLVYDTGALRLYINLSPEAISFIPSFDVTDLAGVCQYLQRTGCKIIPRAGGGSTVCDPFGFLIDLVERPRN